MKYLSWLFIAYLCLGTTNLVFGDQGARVQKILQSNYNKSDAAFTRGDMEEYLSIYAENYAGLEDGGYVLIRNRNALRKIIRREIKAGKREQHSQIQEISVHGNEAVVVVQSNYRHCDFWRMINNSWRLKQSFPLD